MQISTLFICLLAVILQIQMKFVSFWFFCCILSIADLSINDGKGMWPIANEIEQQ